MGVHAAVTAALEPNAAYDLAVVVPRGEADRPVVRATRFRTSRWASPRAFVDALGYTHPTVAPYLPDDWIVPEGMALPAGRRWPVESQCRRTRRTPRERSVSPTLR